MTTRPTFKPEISLGSVIQLAAVIVTMALAWANLNSRVEINSIGVSANAQKIRDIDSMTQARLASVERAEIQNTAQLQNIVDILQRIEKRLDLVEGRPGGRP